MSSVSILSAAQVAVAVFVVVALSAATEVHAAPADPRLGQAEALAKKREVDAAADLYRSLLKDGVDGAGVRYNLGTLALEQGRIGEAVLHLLSARRLAPNDDDVRHNLEVALDARTDRLAGEAATDPVAALGARTAPLVARFALAVPLALLGLLLGALGLVDLAGRDRLRRGLRNGAYAAFALVVVGAAVYAARRSVEGTRTVVVQSDQSALKEPDDAAAVSFPAHAGLYGDVVDESGAFVRVRFENGLEAWLKSAAVDSVY